MPKVAPVSFSQARHSKGSLDIWSSVAKNLGDLLRQAQTNKGQIQLWDQFSSLKKKKKKKPVDAEIPKTSWAPYWQEMLAEGTFYDK